MPAILGVQTVAVKSTEQPGECVGALPWVGDYAETLLENAFTEMRLSVVLTEGRQNPLNDSLKQLLV